jgi:hypothetical protein
VITSIKILSFSGGSFCHPDFRATSSIQTDNEPCRRIRRFSRIKGGFSKNNVKKRSAAADLAVSNQLNHG